MEEKTELTGPMLSYGESDVGKGAGTGRSFTLLEQTEPSKLGGFVLPSSESSVGLGFIGCNYFFLVDM